MGLFLVIMWWVPDSFKHKLECLLDLNRVLGIHFLPVPGIGGNGPAGAGRIGKLKTESPVPAPTALDVRTGYGRVVIGAALPLRSGGGVATTVRSVEAPDVGVCEVAFEAGDVFSRRRSLVEGEEMGPRCERRL